MPPSDPTDIALILAAGRGSRMGTPKALMTVAGTPWWTIQRDRLHRAGVPAIWVVSPAVHDALLTSHGVPEYMILADPDAPMMASIGAGIEALRTQPPVGVFILPIDTPAPSGAVWNALRAIADAPTAPSFDGRTGHPIRLPWSFIASAILPHTADPAWLATARLDRLVAGALRAVPVDDPDVLENLNSPADVERWLASPHRRRDSVS